MRDCPTCDYANNNIDLLMLHPNSSDIDMRMTKETQVMPLDGLISQYGEVWFKVKNLDADKNMTLAVPYEYIHSPCESLKLFASRKPSVRDSFCC